MHSDSLVNAPKYYSLVAFNIGTPYLSHYMSSLVSLNKRFRCCRGYNVFSVMET